MYLMQEIILQHGRHSPFKGKIKHPTLSIKAENKLCGDSIKIDVLIDQNKITEIVFSGDSCLISQAATSLLINKIRKIKKINQIKKINKDTIFNLLGIELTLSRTGCALLSLEALQKAFINY